MFYKCTILAPPVTTVDLKNKGGTTSLKMLGHFLLVLYVSYFSLKNSNIGPKKRQNITTHFTKNFNWCGHLFFTYSFILLFLCSSLDRRSIMKSCHDYNIPLDVTWLKHLGISSFLRPVLHIFPFFPIAL